MNDAFHVPAIVIALILLALAAGCGGALKTNARIAQGFVELQAAAEPVVRDGRVDASVLAAQAVREAGGPIEEAQSAAAAAAERWECAISGHRIFGRAVRTYVDALSLMAAGENFELSAVLPILGRTLSSFSDLRVCLMTLGNESLPELPAFLELIPNEWGVAP